MTGPEPTRGHDQPLAGTPPPMRLRTGAHEWSVTVVGGQFDGKRADMSTDGTAPPPLLILGLDDHGREAWGLPIDNPPTPYPATVELVVRTRRFVGDDRVYLPLREVADRTLLAIRNEVAAAYGVRPDQHDRKCPAFHNPKNGCACGMALIADDLARRFG